MTYRRVTDWLLAAIIAAGIVFLFVNGPAGAEQVAFRNPIAERSVNATSRCANYALGAQVADALTTRMFMKQPGNFEIDPLARGIARSDIGEYGSAIALNLIARKVFRHAPAALCGMAVVETGFVVNNAVLLAR
jgi:hypothetical protein